MLKCLNDLELELATKLSKSVKWQSVNCQFIGFTRDSHLVYSIHYFFFQYQGQLSSCNKLLTWVFFLLKIKFLAAATLCSRFFGASTGIIINPRILHCRKWVHSIINTEAVRSHATGNGRLSTAEGTGDWNSNLTLKGEKYRRISFTFYTVILDNCSLQIFFAMH